MESSPHSTAKLYGTCCTTCAIWLMLPEASFTPTMYSISASRFSVAGSTFTPVRPCTLYTMIGSGTADAMAL